MEISQLNDVLDFLSRLEGNPASDYGRQGNALWRGENESLVHIDFVNMAQIKNLMPEDLLSAYLDTIEFGKKFPGAI